VCMCMRVDMCVYEYVFVCRYSIFIRANITLHVYTRTCARVVRCSDSECLLEIGCFELQGRRFKHLGWFIGVRCSIMKSCMIQTQSHTHTARTRCSDTGVSVTSVCGSAFVLTHNTCVHSRACMCMCVFCVQ
jgi:hypothetical protein